MSKSVQKVLKNSLWQSLGGVAVTGLNFLLVIGYARILGPEQFGSLVSSQAKVIIWAMLVDLGLSHGLIGALTAAESQKDSQERQGFRSRDLIIRVLAVRMAGAMLGAIFILALASAHSNEHSFWQDISFLPYLFALAMQQTAMAYANFRNRQALSVVAMLAGNFSSMAVCLWMAWSGFSLWQLLFVQSLGGFVTAILILISLWSPTPLDSRRLQKEKRGPWAKEAWQALWSDAWPYAIIYGCGVLWNRLDQIAATYFLGNESGGQYALAVRLVAIPTIMASSIGIALFPDLQRVGIDAPAKITTYVGAATKFFYRWGVPMVAVFLFFVALIISPIVPKFREALWLLPWFIPGVWAYFLHSFSISSLYAVRSYKDAVYAHLFSLGAYLVALPIAAKWGGLIGIALAYDLFGCILFIYSLRALRRAAVLPQNFSLMDEYTLEEDKIIGLIRARFKKEKLNDNQRA